MRSIVEFLATTPRLHENSVKREIIDILNKAQVSPIGKSTYEHRGVALPKWIAVPSKYFTVAHGYEMTETEFAKIIQHKSKLPVEAGGVSGLEGIPKKSTNENTRIKTQ